jgi:hypothetical protein
MYHATIKTRLTPSLKKDLSSKNEKISFLKIEGNHKGSIERLGFKRRLKSPSNILAKRRGVTLQDDSL